MKRFGEFVQFKLRLCKRAQRAAEKAGSKTRGEVAIALHEAETANRVTYDLTGVRRNQPPWNGRVRAGS